MNIRDSIPLYTRKRREIPNERESDLDPLRAERATAMLRRDHPFAQMRRPPTGQYNCHGLTFANRRTGIYEPDQIGLILGDDGYRKISLSDVIAGDLVVYFEGSEISHTGIVIEVRDGEPAGSFRVARILSKWGATGEYLHLASEGPYKNNSITYWTDRP